MRLLLLTLSIALLSACAAAPPPKEGAPRMTRTDACVFESSITGFEPLDDRHVLLYGFGKRDPFLAEITPGCFDIKNQTALGAVDGDGNGQICGYGRDNIVYREFGRTESCRIVTLEIATEERIAAVKEQEKNSRKPRKVIIQ